jgi:hypothetical protein
MRSVSRFLFLIISLWSAQSPADELQWPGVPYSYVKGYFYYPMDNLEKSILRDGWLNATVEKLIPISGSEVQALRDAIVPRPQKPQWPASCYEPHHAFIFFDAAGRKPVAHVEICFLCKQAYALPPLPNEKIWGIASLERLCKKLGLPVPGDPEFKAIAGASQAAFEERVNRFRPHLPALEAAEKDKTSPPIEHAWPWMAYAKVKACVFNEEGWKSRLVNFGDINDSITKSIELTSEQQKRVWTAFTAGRETHQTAPHVRMTVGYDGIRFAFIEGLGRIENPPSDSKTIRRGLICLDAQERPVAWLAFSEKDATRLIEPDDTVTPLLNGVLWDPFKLGKIFDELGLSVPPPKPDSEK